jgi:hypothetical protein
LQAHPITCSRRGKCQKKMKKKKGLTRDDPQHLATW